jgi:hypothetical protein
MKKRVFFEGTKETFTRDFQEPQWMSDFGLYVEITGYSNGLIYRLQGQLLHTLYHSIKGFETAPTCGKSILRGNNNSHCVTSVEVNGNMALKSQKYC